MMVVDTSAIVAVALDEPERADIARLILDAHVVLISAVSVVESRIVVQSRRGQAGTIIIDDILRLPNFKIVPPGPTEIEAAFAAFVIYGKGRGNLAQLNLGDLFSYALAKTEGLPLLYKGNDFTHTDLKRVALSM